MSATARPIDGNRPLDGDVRLIRFLERHGHLSAANAKRVAREVALSKDGAIMALDHLELLDDRRVAELIAEELDLPFLDLESVEIDDAAVRLLDEDTAIRFGVIPLRADRGTLVLAMVNPLDHDAVRDIRFRTGLRVRPRVVVLSQLRTTIREQYRIDGSLRSLLRDLPEAENTEPLAAERRGQRSGSAEPAASAEDDAGAAKVARLVLNEAMSRRASDIHIQPGPNVAKVRYRVDGTLVDALDIPRWVHSQVVTRLKVMAELDITKRWIPQDGRVSVRFEGRIVDLRLSTLPTSYGEKVVMRVLDAATSLRSLEAIGLRAGDLAAVRDALRSPEGMVLVTGPTGSGKTTTLYAMIQELHSPGINIVTIENPVEYELEGIAQVSVNEGRGLTFADALRSTLRQDPDVILVGEIRDVETAEIAFRAAQTGHLVLSTLHTNDAVSTVTRLVDLGIDPQVVASSLRAVVAQRLLRTNCPSCAAPTPQAAEGARRLGIADVSRLARGIGCAKCQGSGFAGRVGVHEVLPVRGDVRRAIEAGEGEASILDEARKGTYHSMFEVARDLVAEGRLTADEVEREIGVVHAESCEACGAPLPEGTPICPVCEAARKPVCADCNAVLEPSWNRCPHCDLPAGARPTPYVFAKDTVPDPHLAPAPTFPVPIDARPEREPRDRGPQPPRKEAPPRPGGVRWADLARGTVRPDPSMIDEAGHAPPMPDLPGPSAAVDPIDVVRILLVDDDAHVRKSLKRALRRLPHDVEVVEAADGVEALARVEEDPPHLIVLDFMMPGMDGPEVCRRLRRDMKTALIPVLMLTARADVESRREGFAAGTDDYVVKPFDIDELLARVRRMLRRTYELRPANPAPSAPKTRKRKAG